MAIAGGRFDLRQPPGEADPSRHADSLTHREPEKLARGAVQYRFLEGDGQVHFFLRLPLCQP